LSEILIFLAYAVAFFLGQIGLLVGSLVGALLVSFLNASRLGVIIRSVLAGAIAGFAGAFLAKLSLGWFGFPMTWLALVIWLVIPLYNDLKKAKELKDLYETFEEGPVRTESALNTLGLQMAPYGYVIGVVIAAIVFQPQKFA
jgi:hypothetical protein